MNELTEIIGGAIKNLTLDRDRLILEAMNHFGVYTIEEMNRRSRIEMEGDRNVLYIDDVAAITFMDPEVETNGETVKMTQKTIKHF